MNLVKNIVNYVLSILIAIFIIIFLIIQLAQSTVLSKKYVLSKLDEIDYYGKIHEDVKSNFENYIHQSGLDETVLEDIVSKEKVKKDTQLIISSIYDGVEEQIDTQEIKDNLNKNIEETLDAQVIKTQKEAINKLVDEICNEYTSTLSHYKYENKINRLYTKVKKYIEIAKKVSLVIIAVSIIFLLLLNMKKLYKTFSLFGTSLITSGFFMIIVSLFINSKIKIETILLLNEAISNIIKNVLTEVLHNIKIYSYSMIVAGILLTLIANLIHNQIKYKKNHK